MKKAILVLTLLVSSQVFAEEGSGRAPAHASDVRLHRELTPIATPEDNFQVEGLLPPTEEVELDALTPTTGDSTPLASLVEGE